MRLPWNKLPASQCEHCGTETKGLKLCKECNNVNESHMLYCDGCGEDYPRTHLCYDNRFDGHFCDNCSTPEASDLADRMSRYFS
jgi:hypothetical protein